MSVHRPVRNLKVGDRTDEGTVEEVNPSPDGRVVGVIFVKANGQRVSTFLPASGPEDVIRIDS